MEEHVAILKEHGLPVPRINPYPKITLENEKRRAVACLLCF